MDEAGPHVDGCSYNSLWRLDVLRYSMAGMTAHVLE